MKRQKSKNGLLIDIDPNILIEDYKRIGEIQAFNITSRQTELNRQGLRKTHKDAKFPHGLPTQKPSTRKQMRVQDAEA